MCGASVVLAIVLWSNTEILAEGPLQTATTETDRVALNQAVSLDETPESLAAVENESTVIDSAQTAIMQQDASEAGTIRRESKSPTEERIVRRGRTNDGDMEKKAVRAAWYRSGVVPLAVVLGLIGILYLGVRKLMPARVAAESDALRVAGRISLSARHQAVLVCVGTRTILVGVSPDRLRTLCELGGSMEAARRASETVGAEGAFNSLLSEERLRFERDGSNWTGSAGDEDTESAPSRPETEINGMGIRKLMSRLRDLKAG